MRIASYEYQGTSSYGFVVGDADNPDGLTVVDHADLGLAAPDVASLIASGELPDPGALTGGVPLSAVTLLPPVTAGKILCAGVNFTDHRAEVGSAAERPAYPTIFARYADSVVGHGAPILRDPAIERFDYEGELAVVIGKPAYKVSAADALDHVVGYSCFDDGSARDWQFHTGQWIPGKNFYQSGGFGPWIVTADEVGGEMGDIVLTTRVSGEVRQQAKLADLTFSVAELIEYITAFTPLAPGDVIAAGTPGGVGEFSDPQRLLVPGDVVEVEIDRIGLLRNEITAG